MGVGLRVRSTGDVEQGGDAASRSRLSPVHA